VNGQDKLIIHQAQTTLPDGTVLPVPDYSFNIAAPDDVSGWPEYADWQQQVVCFSGIEDGVVLELDYEVVTPRGVLPWIEADVRLDHEYPIVERVVTVTVPDQATLHYQSDRAAGLVYTETPSDGGGATTHRWAMEDLPSAPGEEGSWPWRQRCPRLRFTTCPDVETWVRTMIERVDRAGRPDQMIKQFADAAAEDELDPAQRVRKVAKKLHDSFNFITSAKTMWGLPCRDAAEVLRTNYGNSLESAAVLLAAVRAMDMKASIAIGVDAGSWTDTDELAPPGGAFAGAVVVVNSPDGAMYVHPQHGVFENPGHWGRHHLLNLDSGGKMQHQYVAARGEKKPSDLQITGKIKVDKDGKASGQLRINLTGAFYDPHDLDTTDAQEALVKGFVGQVLSDFEVAGHSIITLSGDVLKATANVASKDKLKSADKHHMLKFGGGPAFLAEFSLPVDRSYRSTDVHVAGAFREQVNLVVELPEEWTASVVPTSMKPVVGPWGNLSQTVEVEDGKVRFHRAVAITTDTITPDDFAGLRDAVNTLKATRSLVLVCGK
ncbi:MAG: DUF3857 domain-containing protein, partial [Planctomycetes bacterium]|nr:DUF3857 domain-containing protein [Planctomycetota bacterium]